MTLSPTAARQHNIGEFDRLIEIMKKTEIEIKNAEHEVMKATARKFLGALIKRSPILTGRYVKSHKVGIDSPDDSIAPNAYGIAADRKSAASSALMSGLNVIKNAQKFSSIYISNSLHYAKNVEYLGWKNTGPYYVYHHATMDIMEDTSKIIKKYINQAIENAVKKGKNQ